MSHLALAEFQFDPAACWQFITTIPQRHIDRAVEWMNAGKDWPKVGPSKPQRLMSLPDTVFGPIVDTVLACFTEPVGATGLMLSRMAPGQSHDMHHDEQWAPWLTRVHVPLVTNEKCWMAFEDEAALFVDEIDKTHALLFATGKSYTFNTLKRHAFGNGGETERVHFIFDVVRK